MREQFGVAQAMPDAEAGDRIHHEPSVASQRPSGAMAGAYQVGKVTGPSRPSDLYGATRSFTQAAGLVESARSGEPSDPGELPRSSRSAQQHRSS